MTLEEKGDIMPPPIMGTYPQKVSEAVQQWKDVIAASHWDLYDNTKADGADFYVGEKELGHIHLDGAVHLATSHWLMAELLKAKKAEKFPFGGEYEGWTLYNISSEASASHAIWLFKLNYQRLMGVPSGDIINEIKNRHL